FTNAMIREVERSQVATVSTKEVSPITLEGVVESITFEPSGPLTSKELPTLPQNTVLTSQYRIKVHTTMTLRRNSDQQVIWQGKFNGEKVYSAPQIGLAGVNSANALYNHSAQLENIGTLAGTIMAEAHDRMTEKF